MTSKRETLIRQTAADLIYDIAGSVLYAVGLYTFAGNAGFAPGGISGLALILNHIWGLPVGTMTLLFNIPLVAVSYKTVGRRLLMKSAKTTDLPASCFLPCIESALSLPSPYPTAINRLALQSYGHPFVWFDRKNEEWIHVGRFLSAYMQNIRDLLVSISHFTVKLYIIALLLFVDSAKFSTNHQFDTPLLCEFVMEAS